MNILAVDTAGKTVGVALLQDDRLLYECYLDAGMTHSETLMPMRTGWADWISAWSAACICWNCSLAAGAKPQQVPPPGPSAPGSSPRGRPMRSFRPVSVPARPL